LDDIDHPDSDEVTIVNNIQNWMTVIIQIRMRVTVVNIIQNGWHSLSRYEWN